MFDDQEKITEDQKNSDYWNGSQRESAQTYSRVKKVTTSKHAAA